MQGMELPYNWDVSEHINVSFFRSLNLKFKEDNIKKNYFRKYSNNIKSTINRVFFFFLSFIYNTKII